jgi:predicted AAA+ superfamily ATPase
MKRDIYQELYSWKQRPDRKPLILNGARQVGKTTAIKTFAAEVFDDVLFLDFEEDKSLADHFVSLKPERIIESLSVQFARTITPGKTLLVFDEIQACPEALNSLKYFCEQMPELAVISAGSLLGVAIDNTGFPVGKVNMLNLYPLSFFEYLDAIDKTTWREHLENLKNLKAIPNSLHEELLRELRFYMMVGGMPEAVGSFIKNRDLNQVREIQKNILAAYELDFAKHAPKSMLMRI